MKAIIVENLSKSYDGINKVVDNISFSIEKGAIIGFLGPNGSGKTTTVRMLNGVLTPTAGKAEILGKDIVNHTIDIHKICGVMTETAACYENITGKENLFFFGKLHEINPTELKERIDYLLKSLQLYDHKDKKVKEYSTGMKKRISLAIALIHNPKVLFLDEPTSGLDPESGKNVTELIRNMAYENGTTVFMCTHQLKYAEDICTEYGFINKGKILGFGSFQELAESKNSKKHLVVRGKHISESLGFSKLNEDSYRKEINSEEEISEILYNILTQGGQIFEAKSKRCSLEELYFSYVRGDKIE
ncbi:ABC transporter ATP-binding protein [Clostridium lundense]|uniref:ABC transporter ATP-binding protein n=1 Tax=Clostridium lundense TaxID=319475 RepID=UPI00048706A1|nr:ABC transporter ATP-binding protein [Clostridium lundense]